MSSPKASIDRCQNCIYWERVNPDRGVCHVISYPEKFRNRFATIEALDHLAPAALAPRGTAKPVFMPVAEFHCTLYKVGTTK